MSKKSRSKTPCSTKKRPLLHALMGLALLPLLWAVVHQTGMMFPNLLEEGFGSWWLYAAGIGCYLLIERLLARPMWLYVFGHELTHALSGVLSGAKVHSFKAKSSGGEVRLSKSNAFIAISPYIIPLYAVGLIGLYSITRHWWNPPHLLPVFQFLLGMALAFHVSLTVSAIHKHQTDLKVLGFFLSGILIILGNTLILGILGISLFSKTPTLTTYSKTIGHETVVGWKKIIHITWEGTQQMYAFLKEKPWIR